MRNQPLDAAGYAHHESMPMIVITGSKLVMSAKQASFQIVDIAASMKPLTKMKRQIVSAAAVHRPLAALFGSR